MIIPYTTIAIILQKLTYDSSLKLTIYKFNRNYAVKIIFNRKLIYFAY
jgi:hypothetical protein